MTKLFQLARRVALESDIPEEGIGVRLEDDILVTTTGHENLSAALPTSL